MLKADGDLLRYCIRARRHLHREPELSFAEHRTTDFIVGELAETGLVAQRLPESGAYTTLDFGRPGPTIVCRADIDALPIQEESACEYASTTAGAMHACGHDGHTAMLLGLARTLSAQGASARGKVVLVFQPAEESLPGGALGVLECGALAGAEAVLALHFTPELLCGTVGLRAGPFMASADEFTVQIIGKGGHGAKPHRCVDPIVIGSQLVNAWQTLISRTVDPAQPAVLTVGQFHAGTAFNVIPERAKLRGTVRALSEQVRDDLEAGFRRMTAELCAASGASAEIVYDRGYPVLVNDDALTGLARQAAQSALGAENVLEIGQSLGAEDFAYYALAYPALMAYLGGRDEARGIVNSLHSPRFDFAEEAMLVGINYYLAVLQALWERHEQGH